MTGDIKIAKRAVAKHALSYVEDGMVIGLGSGTTSSIFIDMLGDRIASEAINIDCVCTSEQAYRDAVKVGIKVFDINLVSKVDITVDGADEFDADRRIIKGGGGALLREKMISAISSRCIIIADVGKYTDLLGSSFPLPIEIIPFGWKFTSEHIRNCIYDSLGVWCDGKLRKVSGGKSDLFVTDNGNYIVDVWTKGIKDPHLLGNRLNMIPGVVETGLFLDLRGIVVVGDHNGNISILD